MSTEPDFSISVSGHMYGYLDYFFPEAQLTYAKLSHIYQNTIKVLPAYK